MTKVLKILAVFAMIAFLAVSCGDSKKSGDNRQEYEGDGSEEYVTVGNAYESDSAKGGEDYADEAAGDAEAPAEDGENGSGDAEREIVESDIYKFDGNVLWLANQYKGLIAVDIKDRENLKIIGNLRFQGYVGEMYLQEGRAYILVSYTNSSYELDEIYYSNKTYSKLMVVNTEDPANLSLIGEFEIDGWITDSRQVGDVIYVASTEYTYYWYGCDGDGGESGRNQISIMSINVKDPKNIKMADKVSVEGYGYTLYVSQKSIYVAEADTYYWTEDYDKGYPVTMFDISDPEGKIVKKAEFRTDGFMSDRWKMHESGNTFFAVSSSTSWGNGDSMIESFDVSDPKNVKRLDKLIFMTNQQLYGTKFEGDRMYAVTYFQQDPLHVIDISDPANLKQLGELQVPGWSTHLEVRGTRILATGRDGNNSKISLYDVADPENPKEINTVTIGSGYSYSEAEDDWKAFKIFDELNLILYPVTDYGENWETRYKLYLVDFDLDKGLKTRGFIQSDSYIRRGVAIQDLIFSIGENHLVTADATDRDKPKILSELTLATNVSNVAKCGKSLCSLYGSQLSVYDKDNFDKLWESKPLDNYYYDIKMTKNSQYAYIYNYSYRWWNEYDPYDEGEENSDPKTPTIKVIKFADDGKFEEVGDFPFNAKISNEERVVSENNVIAAVSWQEVLYEEDDEFDYDSYYSQGERKIMFFDMNDPAEGIKESVLDFDYETLSYTTGIFVNGNTFWTSGCKLKKADENGDQYLCYALPFDVSDPKNPKEGKRVNIPGELAGISENGKYLYTKTPEIYHYDNGEDSESDTYYWSSSSDYDFYILKLNEDKAAVKVVKKETLSYTYGYDGDIYESVYDSVYPKNDKVFFVKVSTGEQWNTCSYRTEKHYEIRIVSASDGKETYKKSFDNANSVLDVNDGGILLSTADGWTYISPDGKEKSGSENISSVSSYGYDYYDSYYYYYNAKPQLIDGTVYIAAGWDGIYSLNVK